MFFIAGGGEALVDMSAINVSFIWKAETQKCLHKIKESSIFFFICYDNSKRCFFFNIHITFFTNKGTYISTMKY